MNSMLLLIFGSMILGLWTPRRKQFAWVVGVGAVLLVVMFYIAPYRM